MDTEHWTPAPNHALRKPSIRRWFIFYARQSRLAVVSDLCGSVMYKEPIIIHETHLHPNHHPKERFLVISNCDAVAKPIPMILAALLLTTQLTVAAAFCDEAKCIVACGAKGGRCLGFQCFCN